MPHQRYVSKELTHFVGRGLETDDERYSLLIRIMRDGHLGRNDADHPNGGGFTLSVDGGKDPLTNEMYHLPMVCFCDIPPDDFELHMSKYSRFGIAFRKSFLIGKGARPVFYIPLPEADKHSSYNHNFQSLADLNNIGSQLVLTTGPNPGAPARCTEDVRSLVSRLNFAMSRLTLDVLSYIKFFDPHTADEDRANFYMEREWRIPGTVDFTTNHVSRLVLPASFAPRLRQDVAGYIGQVTFAD